MASKRLHSNLGDSINSYESHSKIKGREQVPPVATDLFPFTPKLISKAVCTDSLYLFPSFLNKPLKSKGALFSLHLTGSLRSI